MKLIRFFAGIDLLIGLTLATPVLGPWLLQLLHQQLDSGTLLLDEYHSVLLQVLGVMTILWAVVRLQQTARWQIMYDCTARLLIIAMMGYYYYQGTALLGLFIIVEWLGMVQLWVLRRSKA